MNLSIRGLTSSVLMLCIAFSTQVLHAKDKKIPAPEVDVGLAANHGEESIVLAGGCFWGIQAVFQHVKGVISAISGYSGGQAKTAKYEVVGTGRTGHAESVRVIFDPSQVTFGQLLQIFFTAHDPTELNRQGPDEGSQYRSVVFYATPEQQRITKAYIEQLGKAGIFKHAIVTQLLPLREFFPAEVYHQNYATLYPNDAYIWENDAPKLLKLKREFPQLYRESPNLVAVK